MKRIEGSMKNRLGILAAGFVAWFSLGASLHAAVVYAVPPMEAVKACLQDREDASKAAAINLVTFAAQNENTRPELARELTQLLETPGLGVDKKNLLCQLLAIAGDAKSVPALARLLRDSESADAARLALEAIPDKAAAGALRKALGEARGNVLIGVVNSLGARRDEGAAGAIAKLVSSADQDVARAALNALGRIGTPECARRLERVQRERGEKLRQHVLEAQLTCASQLSADLNLKEAVALYQKLSGEGNPATIRLGGLHGLVTSAPGPVALSGVLMGIQDQDPLLAAGAIALAARIKGEAATLAFTELLQSLNTRRTALLLHALGQRGDPVALRAVIARLQSPDDGVRLAAVEAVGLLGNAESVATLLQVAASARGEVQAAAQASLNKLNGQGVSDALDRAARAGEAAIRIAALKAVSARRHKDARDLLFKLADDSEKTVRVAALKALGSWVQRDDYPALVGRLAQANTPEDAGALANLVLVAAKGMDAQARVAPLGAAYARSRGEGRLAILQAAGSIGGEESLKLVLGAMKEGDAAVREAALQSLGDWPDATAAPMLYEVAKNTSNSAERELASRGYFRVAAMGANAPAELTTRGAELATTAGMKRVWLSSLGTVTNAVALKTASSLLEDPDVRREAEQATLRIAAGLVMAEPTLVTETMGKLIAGTRDEAAIKSARELIRRAESPVELLTPLPYAIELIAGREGALREKAGTDRLICYLDCGAKGTAGGPTGPMILQANGKSWWYPGSEQAAPGPFGSMAFESPHLQFLIKNLDRTRRYAVGFTWWDYDGNGRVQSVEVLNSAGEVRQAVEQQKLPSYTQAKKLPQEFRVVLNPEDYKDGKLTIRFVCHSGPNAVLSDIWLSEAAADAEPGVSSKPAFESSAVDRAPVDMNPPAGGVSVLIVTGIDYPGHPWKETSQALKTALEEDARLKVRIVEDPELLASPQLGLWDVVIIHFQDWQVPGPGAAARENLARYVASGKGLALTHFACGAWDDNEWPEFVRLAGRIWDPKLRGHDPHGTFTVDIADPAHPITRGMKPFETLDELYTCLAGETPMHVVAKATSKVDQKEYPMAFVLNYGEGRVFHCVLGHDARAYASAGVRELVRRGVLWTAGKLDTPAQ